ncbi:heterogeneous nuclear ribonucleoproteins C1/C2-like [Monodelphis domestica]|uniref:heterogeneous nuclear ribonucleoproteins C1/C2-like n=1 Tax=Monodelphis domestica TaxID=13616 RepID=UPI0004431381|nr:heterogeneous nuclear ribonucleoproteins C1/C2-like [Monodelphis domestica]
MSGNTPADKGDSSDEYCGSSSGSSCSFQECWESNVPELICKEESLDDDLPDSELAMEPSPSQDMEIKGIMSRKGKGGSYARGRQRASIIKAGRGKGDPQQATRKDLRKTEEKGDTLLAIQEEKEKEKAGEAMSEDVENNNDQPQSEATMEKEGEGGGDSFGNRA